MANYKDIRYQYKKDIDNGTCWCILSGLQIKDPRQLSLEHFVPLSKGPHYESKQAYNIFPAFKIINGLKGCLLPCEFFNQREALLKKTLSKGHLNRKNEEIIQATLDNIPNYQINPCTYCFLSTNCHRSR